MPKGSPYYRTNHQRHLCCRENTGTLGEAVREIAKAPSLFVTEPHRWFREARLRDFGSMSREQKEKREISIAEVPDLHRCVGTEAAPFAETAWK